MPNSLSIFLPFCWHIRGMELSHLGDKSYNSTESIAKSWLFFIIKNCKNQSPRVIFQCYISSGLREGSRTLTIIVEQWLILWKVRTDSSQTKNVLLFKPIGCDQKIKKRKILCVHACTRRREVRMLSNGLLKYQQCLDIVLIVLTPCKSTLSEEHHSACLCTRVLVESTGPVKTAGRKKILDLVLTCARTSLTRCHFFGRSVHTVFCICLSFLLLC